MPVVRTATVVVPTFRRPDGLARALAGLARQRDPGVRWDVVVVDNDDAPGAIPVFEAAAFPAERNARLVREARRGASSARNRGIADAGGDVVAFMDDDVVPADDWLLELVTPIVHGRADATGGRVVLDPTVARPAWFDEPALGPYLAAHAPATDERDLAADEFVITASAAFRADLLRLAGGFDPELGPRPGSQLVNDDVLLCDRFVGVGGRVRHVPASVVVHELPAARLRPGYLIRRAYAQGRSDWRYHVRTIGRRGAVERQLTWLVGEARGRWRDGPLSRPVAFHALCDLARAAGAARDALDIDQARAVREARSSRARS
jgi:glycosyltransferase involved in cell wall biosynthesis